MVLIFADDLGYGDVTAFDPRSKIHTPNIDRLAREGMKFTDAHTASGVCTPSRYALLTGRYAWRSRLKQGVLGGFSPPLIEPDRLTMAQLLKRCGYHTACIGKWHLGLGWAKSGERPDDPRASNDATGIDFTRPIDPSPNDYGFDYYFGIAASLDMPPYVFIENDRVTVQPTSTLAKEDTGGRPGPAAPGWRHKHVLPALTAKAIEFIEQHRDGPFFVYLSLNAPHTPHAPADEFIGRSGLDIYGDFVVQVDHTVGQVMQALRRLDLEKNTIVVLTSDNGPETNMFPRKAKTGHDSSSHFLGAKRDNWEGGHRVPLIVRWPGRVEAGSACHEPVSLVDMMATIADVIGQPLPADQAVDSVTMLPLWLGQDASYRKDHGIILHSSRGLFGIRLGDWKLLLHSGSGGNNYDARGRNAGRYAGTPEQAAAQRGPRQLYNVRTDPDETQNVADQHPELVRQLTELAARYVRQGRSTPGPRQQNAGGTWSQLEWLEQMAGESAGRGGR